MAINKTLRYFKGQEVQVFTEMVQRKTDSEGNMVEGSIVIQGILIDADREYVYLGTIVNSNLVVTDEIPRNSIANIRNTALDDIGFEGQIGEVN